MAVACHFKAAIAGGYTLSPYDFNYLLNNGLKDLSYWVKLSQKATETRATVAEIRHFYTAMAVQLMKHPQSAASGKRYINDLHKQLNQKPKTKAQTLNAPAWAQSQSRVQALLNPQPN